MAEGTLGGVDYTRDLSAIGGDFSDIAKELESRKDAKRRKRARERMAMLMAQSSSSMQTPDYRGIRVSYVDSSKGEDGDDRMSGGVSLALGSAAHLEYVQERSGMDSFERERANLAAEGFGTKSDMEAPGPDEFHEERYDKLSNQDTERGEREADLRELEGKAEGHVQASRVIKGSQAESIIDFARRKAAYTVGDDDNAFVDDNLKEIMDKFVYSDERHDISSEKGITESVLDSIASHDSELQV